MKSKRQRFVRGMTVIVKNNVYRLEELHERIDKLPPKPSFPNRDDYSTVEIFYEAMFIYNRQMLPYKRQYVLYANQGDIGTVTDVFKVRKHRNRVDFYAKVQIGNKIKTFRFGSLDKI